jgi:phosphoenolpyruvate synthase/pyruvate phosphate dikinase
MNKEIFFKGNKFCFLARRKSSFIIDHLIKSGELEFYRILGLDVPFRSLVRSENGVAEIYANQDSLDYFKNVFFNKLQNQNIFNGLRNTIHITGQKLIDSIYSKDFNLNSFFLSYKKFIPALAITTSLATNVQELVFKEMKKKGFKTQDLDALLYSSEKSILQKENLDSLKISQKIQKDKTNIKNNFFLNEIKKHYEKYKHLPVNYGGEEWNLDYFTNKIFLQSEELNCDKEIEMIISHDIRLKQKRRCLLTNTDSFLFDFAINFGNLNEYRKNIISKANLELMKQLKYFSQKNHILINDVNNLSYNEILNPKINQSDYTKLIKKRKKGFINISLDKIYTFTNLNLFNENNYKLESKSELNGICASSGCVVGKIRLIEKYKNYSPNRNDILVASMTSVDTVNYLRNTKGIITDEGGITCHAAIVARELEKPCLVGLKIATKVLNDGDYVLLDSDKGLVKKISEEEYNFMNKSNILVSKKKRNGTILIEPKHYDSDIIPLDKSSLNVDCGSKVNKLIEIISNTNVPNGFIITPKAMHSFLNENNLLQKTKNKDYNQIIQIFINSKFNKSFKRRLIKNYKPFSFKDVVARSSNSLEDLPNLSFAGQYESYLKLKNIKELEKAIKKCWASCYNPRVCDYLNDNNIIAEKPEMSVLVQEQIYAKKSGVLFTANPLNGSTSEYVLEVVEDDCESLVSGIKTPTLYQKFKTEIMSDYESLIKKAFECERKFRFPLDIEWCIDNNNKFYILQLRAITTLK